MRYFKILIDQRLWHDGPGSLTCEIWNARAWYLMLLNIFSLSHRILQNSTNLRRKDLSCFDALPLPFWLSPQFILFSNDIQTNSHKLAVRAPNLKSLSDMYNVFLKCSISIKIFHNLSASL